MGDRLILKVQPPISARQGFMFRLFSGNNILLSVIVNSSIIGISPGSSVVNTPPKQVARIFAFSHNNLW